MNWYAVCVRGDSSSKDSVVNGGRSVRRLKFEAGVRFPTAVNQYTLSQTSRNDFRETDAVFIQGCSLRKPTAKTGGLFYAILCCQYF